MPFVVIEDCIRCKYMDCVVRCPVNCFYEGETMLVINPDECIDCAACETNCPVNAIISDSDSRAAKWLSFNRQYAAMWPRITKKGEPPTDAAEWNGVPGKYPKYFKAESGTCHLQEQNEQA